MSADDVKQTIDGAPHVALDDQMVIDELAQLPPLEYDRVRKAKAEVLGVKTATLDMEVRKRRSNGQDDDQAGSAVLFAKLEPWPESVDGAEVLNDLRSTFSCHLILPEGGADVLALWTLHSHAHDTARVSPLLAILSPEKRCGKTTLMGLLQAVVRRPLPASNITSAALFRAVELYQPTLLVDEADTFIRNSDELRGILNSGHTRSGAFVIRTVGDDHEPRTFSTWAPKAVALIGKLHPTLTDRALIVRMRRKAPGESVQRLRLDRLGHLAHLPRRSARWAADNETALREADPDIPPGLHDRAADNWRHLLAIAYAAGGDWPSRARRAAALVSEAQADESAAVQLLGDLRDLFQLRNTDRLSSADVVSHLETLEERPWPEWSRGKPITQRQLAKLLKPFDVVPVSVRLTDGSTPKGYKLEQLEDAFRRYLPSVSATTPQASNDAGSSAFPSARASQSVADADYSKASSRAGCGGVADEKGGSHRDSALDGDPKECCEWI